MADIFDVIADPTRRQLLGLLLDHYVGSDAGEASVSELVAASGVSQPTVSKHLKVLREAGLVTVREMGQHRYYRLEASPLEQLEDWVIPFLSADFDGDEGATVFAAWSGSSMPEPLRRVADVIEHSADAGAAVGRTVAEASHHVRTVVEDVTSTLERKVIDPLKDRLGRNHDE